MAYIRICNDLTDRYCVIQCGFQHISAVVSVVLCYEKFSSSSANIKTVVVGIVRALLLALFLGQNGTER